MNREPLDESADDHDDGSAEDGPPAAETVIDIGDQGQRENGTERVGRGNDALEGTLRVIEVWKMAGSVSTLCIWQRKDDDCYNSHCFQNGTIWRALII